MTTTAPRPASLAYQLAIFIAFVIGCLILLLGVTYVLETYFQISLENSSMGIIILMVAAMSTGTAWRQREGATPSSGRKWTFALCAAALVLAAQITMFYAVLNANIAIMRELAGESTAIKAIFAGGIFFFDLLIIRIGVWLGVRSAAKQAARLAAKGR